MLNAETIRLRAVRKRGAADALRVQVDAAGAEDYAYLWPVWFACTMLADRLRYVYGRMIGRRARAERKGVAL